jgi:hypothetical protein
VLALNQAQMGERMAVAWHLDKSMREFLQATWRVRVVKWGRALAWSPLA